MPLETDRTAIAEGPLTAGGTPFLLSAVGTAHVEAAGYVEAEYVVHGTACRYRPVGELGPDGAWETEVDPDATAEFRTRILVRRPADPARFRGLVVAEWHNVSAGHDTAPDWTYLAAEILRTGAIWVGVSAQRIGVEGGDSLVGMPASAGLKGTDPARYGSLSHPGDAYAFDIFSQIGRLLRDPSTPALGAAPDAVGHATSGDVLDVLDGLRPARLLAFGESQSAFMLTTYYNAVHRHAEVFDGFGIHSRGGPAASLTEGLTLRANPSEGDGTIGVGSGVRLRTDLDAPVITIEAETDLGPILGFVHARQPDHDRLRTWEIAGTAHADASQLGGMRNLFGCSHAVNDGPQGLVVRAALRALDRWVANGTAPAHAAPLETTTDGLIVRDADGIARGGVRTPLVDVPAAVLTGDPPVCGNPLCRLFGETIPFGADVLADRYGDADAYAAATAAAADAAIAAGFICPEDREPLLAMCQTDATFT